MKKAAATPTPTLPGAPTSEVEENKFGNVSGPPTVVTLERDSDGKSNDGSCGNLTVDRDKVEKKGDSAQLIDVSYTPLKASPKATAATAIAIAIKKVMQQTIRIMVWVQRMIPSPSLVTMGLLWPPAPMSLVIPPPPKRL